MTIDAEATSRRIEGRGAAAADRLALVDTSWMPAAACRGVDPDLFFTERGERTSPAKAVCRDCPVRVKCLDYALDTGQHFGVWGGASERERRRMPRGRRRAS